MAAQRNRGRILIEAAKAIGFHALDAGSQASPEGQVYRQAVTPVNAVINVLRKIELNASGQSVWQYEARAASTPSSAGVVTATNAQQGFILFTTQSGDLRVPQVKNELYDTVPFASERLLCNRDAVMHAAAEHKKAEKKAPPHTQTRSGCASDSRGVPKTLGSTWSLRCSGERSRRSRGSGHGGGRLAWPGCAPLRSHQRSFLIAAVEAPKLRAAAKFVNQ